MLFLIVKITRYGDCEEHNHTLEESDRFKRNSKLRKLAGQEMKKRYRARDIKAAIKSNNDPAANAELEAAGGQFFNIFDVHNAGKKWKMSNPDPALLGAKLSIESQWLELAEYLEEGKFSYTIVPIW